MPPHEIGVTHDDPRGSLIAALRAGNFSGQIAAIARSEADLALLRAKGTDIVLSPFADAAERAMERIFGIGLSTEADSLPASEVERSA